MLAGTLEAFALHGQRVWFLFSRAAAYASHPDHPDAMFFGQGQQSTSIAASAQGFF